MSSEETPKRDFLIHFTSGQYRLFSLHEYELRLLKEMMLKTTGRLVYSELE